MDRSTGKELVVWPHPEGSGQWLGVLTDISDKWCPLGNITDGIVCALNKNADDTKLGLVHTWRMRYQPKGPGKAQEVGPREFNEV